MKNKPYKRFWTPYSWQTIIILLIILFGIFLIWWGGGFNLA